MLMGVEMDIQRDEAFEKWHFNKYYVKDADKALLYEKFESKDEYVSYEVQHSYVAWQAAKANSVPSVILNCNQLHQALSFGAPEIAKTKEEIAHLPSYKDDVEFQLGTEMSIEYLKHGHSGEGLYCWYSDLPEEGSILLTEELEAQEPSHD